MAVSASDTPVKVDISQSGIKGEAGADGTNGIGFNNVKKTILDNPLCWLYKKNNIVNILNQVLTVSRPSVGSYTDIYGQAQTAEADTPREEVNGWLIDNTETHTFNVFNNIPNLANPFTAVANIGAYNEAVTEQAVFSIPSTAGNILSLGTNSSGNWIASIKGSDDIVYSAESVITANSTDPKIIIVEYDSGVLNININNSLAGTVTLPTGAISAMKLDDSVELSGNFTANIRGLRFYDIILNTDEKTYINE